MIKGKAKLEFGAGDIRMTPVLSNDVGALLCITQVAHNIGEKVPLDDTWTEKEAQVIITFTCTESIDVLIANLQDIKAMMRDEYPVEDMISFERAFDFDAFIKTEV